MLSSVSIYIRAAGARGTLARFLFPTSLSATALCPRFYISHYAAKPAWGFYLSLSLSFRVRSRVPCRLSSRPRRPIHTVLTVMQPSSYRGTDESKSPSPLPFCRDKKHKNNVRRKTWTGSNTTLKHRGSKRPGEGSNSSCLRCLRTHRPRPPHPGTQDDDGPDTQRT